MNQTGKIFILRPTDVLGKVGDPVSNRLTECSRHPHTPLGLPAPYLVPLSDKCLTWHLER